MLWLSLVVPWFFVQRSRELNKDLSKFHDLTALRSNATTTQPRFTSIIALRRDCGGQSESEGCKSPSHRTPVSGRPLAIDVSPFFPPNLDYAQFSFNGALRLFQSSNKAPTKKRHKRRRAVVQRASRGLCFLNLRTFHFSLTASAACSACRGSARN